MSDYADSLEPMIRAVLSGADLSTVSAKAVRKQLVADGADADRVKEHRSEIDAKITEIYDELAGNNDEDDEESSEEDVPLVKAEPTNNKPKVKAEKDQVESDAAMAKRMQAELDAASRGRERRAAAASPKKKKSVATKKKAKKRSASDVEDSDDEKPKKKRGGGGGAFNKELILSDALGNFLQEERLSRPQTVKRIWDYVKANGLQDQNDKRFILCDDAMKNVFHTDKLHMFTMNKLLGAHFRDPDEVV